MKSDEEGTWNWSIEEETYFPQLLDEEEKTQANSLLQEPTTLTA